MLRARARRRSWTRAGALAFAGAAAVAALAVIAVSLRSEPARPDVEFAAPSALEATSGASAPAVSEQADGGSILAEISADGRFVVFMSDATNLVPGDTNFASDTFVRDLSTGRLERVSVSSSGAQGNGDSLSATISRDGRYVAFRSAASNLVPGDTNKATDIFVRDRVAGTTTRVSESSEGAQANSDSDSAAISADGRVVAFRSLATNLDPRDKNRRPDIFVRDLAEGRTELVSLSFSGSPSNGESRSPSIAADGSRVAFASLANNLTMKDTNGTWDVFVRDVPSGVTLRASLSSDGDQGTLASLLPSLSGDGNSVAFVSKSPNLVPGDTNRMRDAFVRDLATEQLSRVSVTGAGEQANGPASSAALSADGRFVAFSSDATNLVPKDRNRHRDVFVLDRASGAVRLVSLASDGTPGSGDSGGPSLSADGRFVAFQSYASTLSAGDENDVRDVFVHDTANGTTGRASAGAR